MPSDPNRVLIIEDDAGLAELMSEALQRQGMQTSIVGTGRECLDWLASHQTDLLLIDYSLPDMSGSSLIEELRGRGAIPPFVVTTGHGDEEVAVQVMKLGALDYLVKDARMLEHVAGVMVRALKEVASERRIESAERALRESVQQFHAITAASPDALIVTRLSDGLLLYVNEQCGRIFGATAAELMGRRAPDFYCDAADRRKLLKAVARSAETTALEFRLKRVKGDPIWALVTARRGVFGGSEAIYAGIRDITEQRQSEAALKESEERLRAFLEHSATIAWAKDAEGRHIFVSPNFERRFNIRAAEWLGKTDFELWPREVAERSHANDQRALQERRTIETVEEARNPDGSISWWFVSKFAFNDANGQPRVGGLGIDITDRKLAEESVRQSEARLREAQRLAKIGDWEWSLERQTLHWSDEVFRIFGVAPGAFQPSAEAFEATIHPDDRPEFRKKRSQMLEERQATCIDHRIVRPDGEVRFVQENTRLILDGEGKVARVIGTVQDMTETRRAQADFKMLFETMIDGFALHEIVCDAAGKPVDYRFLAVNPAFTRLTGLEAALVVGRTAREVLPRIEPFWIETYGAVALTGKPAQFEHYSADLEKFFEVAAFQTSPGLFATVFVDETDRWKAQQALARNEAELAALYQHAPVMMLLLDSGGKVRRVNRAALDYSGRANAALLLDQGPGVLLGYVNVGLGPDGCGSSPHCTACGLHLAAIAASGSEAPQRRIEVTVHRMSEGQEVAAVLLASTAQIDVDGNRMTLLCLEDVTKQKAAEDRVREQAALLNVTHDAVLVLDFDGRVTFWNRGAEKLFGCTTLQAVGQLLRDQGIEDSEPGIGAILEAVRAAGRWNGEWRLRLRSGEGVVANCRGVLMTNSAGEARSVLLTASDITEAKRLETQFLRAQRLDTLGSLAGGVAHDLNNVLTPIMMSVGMLRELAKAPHDIELVHLIDDSARRGANIIRQLLQFGRGSEGSSEQLHVALVANEIALIIQGTFPKNIVFSRELPADLWPVNADATQLHQVLLNLCVNARDAMPSGGHLALAACNRHIDAATAASQLGARPGPHVVIRVSDNGSGMSAAVIEKIFDPFFTTKPPGQGSGLGLPAVLNIVRRHRGFVTVKSEPGCGSEFAVHLPAALTAAEIQQPDLSTGVRRGAERLVLVVDDETAVRTLIERALEHAGYRALMASDGRSALALFADRADEIELVISDMMMPGMDGVTTIRHLRERRPDLPVLAISGVRTTSVALEELPPPRIGFLEKPFAIEAFLHAVYQAVESGHRAR